MHPVKPRPTLLVILDGLGLNPRHDSNGFALANKPCLDSLLRDWPHTTLTTFGRRVGLPEGQMGNSEVGHLNIGAGRVIDQWLVRISSSLSGNGVASLPPFTAFQRATEKAKTIHLIGLFSDGGVHSHMDHLGLLLPVLQATTSANLALHLITDGRDTPPNSAKGYLESFLQKLPTLAPRASIATICGRFYAMDRDNRWERIQRAYDLVVKGAAATTTDSPLQAVAAAYAAGQTDEFIEPIRCSINTTPYAGVQPGDGIIFWNFRSDRMREIVRALTNPSVPAELIRAQVPFSPEQSLCFTDYDPNLRLPVLFPEMEIANYLGAVVADHGLHQFRTAETEKYPHVTYFLNAGNETPSPNEERALVPSPRDVKTYDLKPEMSAPAVAEGLCSAILSKKFDFLVVNFANCDMVGHTGNLVAAIKATETVDHCLAQVLGALKEVGGQALILADHGNCEQMIDYVTGAPHTAHTTFPVPCILWNAEEGLTLTTDGALCDVAPTLLALLNVPQPAEMTGRSLLTK
jgi:2,3-bisphosphoglycerate-independent phosphoglycerate mutase